MKAGVGRSGVGGKRGGSGAPLSRVPSTSRMGLGRQLEGSLRLVSAFRACAAIQGASRRGPRVTHRGTLVGRRAQAVARHTGHSSGRYAAWAVAEACGGQAGRVQRPASSLLNACGAQAADCHPPQAAPRPSQGQTRPVGASPTWTSLDRAPPWRTALAALALAPRRLARTLRQIAKPQALAVGLCSRPEA